MQAIQSIAGVLTQGTNVIDGVKLFEFVNTTITDARSKSEHWWKTQDTLILLKCGTMFVRFLAVNPLTRQPPKNMIPRFTFYNTH